MAQEFDSDKARKFSELLIRALEGSCESVGDVKILASVLSAWGVRLRTEYPETLIKPTVDA